MTAIDRTDVFRRYSLKWPESFTRWSQASKFTAAIILLVAGMPPASAAPGWTNIEDGQPLPACSDPYQADPPCWNQSPYADVGVAQTRVGDEFFVTLTSIPLTPPPIPPGPHGPSLSWYGQTKAHVSSAQAWNNFLWNLRDENDWPLNCESETSCTYRINNNFPYHFQRPGRYWSTVSIGTAHEMCDNTNGCTWYGGPLRAVPIYVDHPLDYVYVPPDPGVDAAVQAEATISEQNWDEGKLIATYTAKVTNIGDENAENVSLTAVFPGDLTTVLSVSDTANCLLPGISDPHFIAPDNLRLRMGGAVKCNWSTLASGDFREVEVRVRILNATDFDALQSGVVLKKYDQYVGTVTQGVLFKVSADEDVNSSNNEELIKVDIPFRTGTYEDTETAMLAMAPHFDYYTDILFSACNSYMDDIFSRLEATRLQAPEAFNGLSYGKVTSGQYPILLGALESSGHVGVVVYPKGTNYRETGVIIHGTPTQSPLNLNSKLGPDDASIASSAIFLVSSTSLGGFYYRTRVEGFPGFPQYEASGGFEGEYSDNAAEFTYGGATPDAILPDPNPAQCALPPNAVAVVTESPVDLTITNPAGNVVATAGDEIVEQSLGMGIHSMAFEHDDGSYGWVIVLPKDEYTVKLTGSATGPYKLTLTTYNDQGEPEESIIEGYTKAGKVETFNLAGEPLEPTPPGTGPQNGGNSGSGGGGGFGLPTLLALLMLSLWLWRREIQARARVAINAIRGTPEA